MHVGTLEPTILTATWSLFVAPVRGLACARDCGPASRACSGCRWRAYSEYWLRSVQKLIVTKYSSSAVDWSCSRCLRLCVLTPILRDLPSRKKRTPEVDLRVYSKTVDVSIGSPSSYSKFRGPAAGLARCCPSANMSVRISFSSLSSSVLSLMYFSIIWWLKNRHGHWVCWMSAGK